jgi:hypothetical protein
MLVEVSHGHRHAGEDPDARRRRVEPEAHPRVKLEPPTHLVCQGAERKNPLGLDVILGLPGEFTLQAKAPPEFPGEGQRRLQAGFAAAALTAHVEVGGVKVNLGPPDLFAHKGDDFMIDAARAQPSPFPSLADGSFT